MITNIYIYVLLIYTEVCIAVAQRTFDENIIQFSTGETTFILYKNTQNGNNISPLPDFRALNSSLCGFYCICLKFYFIILVPYKICG